MTPSLCGTFLTDKKSLVAFTWTITTILTALAFIVSSSMIIHVHSHYIWYERTYGYNNNRRYMQEGEGGGHGDGGQKGGSGDHHSGSGDNHDSNESFTLSMKSGGSVVFVSVYTMIITMGLSLYGTTAIVGFTSLRGDYIGPCFSSSGSSSLKLGVFGGAIIMFANLLLVCAVFFGEVIVEDWKNAAQDEREVYEIERIASILEVTFMFLAALYSIFAVLLFLFFGSIEGAELDEDAIIGSKALKSISNNDPRLESFITLGEPS